LNNDGIFGVNNKASGNTFQIAFENNFIGPNFFFNPLSMLSPCNVNNNSINSLNTSSQKIKEMEKDKEYFYQHPHNNMNPLNNLLNFNNLNNIPIPVNLSTGCEIDKVKDKTTPEKQEKSKSNKSLSLNVDDINHTDTTRIFKDSLSNKKKIFQNKIVCIDQHDPFKEKEEDDQFKKDSLNNSNSINSTKSYKSPVSTMSDTTQKNSINNFFVSPRSCFTKN
jgi:hypothetical protein